MSYDEKIKYDRKKRNPANPTKKNITEKQNQNSKSVNIFKIDKVHLTDVKSNHEFSYDIDLDEMRYFIDQIAYLTEQSNY